MDYSNKTLLQQYLNKLDKMYHQRSEKNPLTDWVMNVLNITNVQTILEHPELFEDSADYDLFVAENKPKEREMLLYGLGAIPFFQTSLSSRINTQINSLFTNYTYPKEFSTQYQLNELKEDLAQHQSNQIYRFIDNSNKKLMDTVDGYSKKQVAEMQRKNVQKLKIILEQHERQKDNTLQYASEIFSPEPHKYKQWIWTPNQRTRHTQMADKIVPVDELFHVVSDQKHCSDDYMRFPLDPSGSDCQCFNCKCMVLYTNKRDGL